MPYKDAEANKSYQRKYQRRRNREANPPAPFPADLQPMRRLRTAHDVLDRLQVHLSAIEGDESLPTISRARAARELLATALKALEITDLGGRLTRLEELMRQRGIALPMARPALPSPDGDGTGGAAGDRGDDPEVL